jgi:hypothetical protein
VETANAAALGILRYSLVRSAVKEVIRAEQKRGLLLQSYVLGLRHGPKTVCAAHLEQHYYNPDFHHLAYGSRTLVDTDLLEQKEALNSATRVKVYNWESDLKW